MSKFLAIAVAPFLVAAGAKVELPAPLERKGAIASLLRYSHNSSGSAQHRRGKAKSGDAGVSEVIKSLQDIVTTIDGYQDATKELAATRKGKCEADSKTLNKLILDGGRDQTGATEDLEAITAEVTGVQTDCEATKGKVTSTSGEIDSLVQQLKELRANYESSKQETRASLQQVEAVISQRSSRDVAQKVEAQADKLGSALRSQVSELEDLGDRLSAVSFVQQSTHKRHHGKHRGHGRHKQLRGAPVDEAKNSGVVVLQEDRQQLVAANKDSDQDFDDEEKRLIDLIEMKRDEMAKLEASVRDLQPAVADKLKQAAEVNRTLRAAQRGITRDQALLQELDTSCTTLATIADGEVKTRFKLSGVVRMAEKILETMDTTLFLARDVQDLSVPSVPMAFVQLASRSDSQEEVEDATAGPFDEVQQMISTLISELRDQAAGDMDQHQFCSESVAKNRQARHTVENAIDVKKSEILWAETAIARLDDEVSFYEAEKARLTQAAADAATELSDEKTQRDREAADRTIAGQVVVKAVDVLNELCDLNAAGTTFLAVNTSVISGRKLSQCEEAVSLLSEAESLIVSNGQAAATNLGSITTLLNGLKDNANTAAEARNTDLLSAKSAHGRRADELAGAKADLAGKVTDLALIQKSQKDLETNCGPKQETHEERMGRRADEIDALKNALSVLEGESVPVAMVQESDESDE